MILMTNILLMCAPEKEMSKVTRKYAHKAGIEAEERNSKKY
jgi:hypothetical protein